MSRVALIDPANTTASRREPLEQIHAAFGATPNMFRAVANSPAALRSMWGSFGALSAGALSPKLAEQIAVAVADRNACAYCLAAHTALGRKAGATEQELTDAQGGEAADPKTAAALRFALKIVDGRGQLEDGEVHRMRQLGWTDEEIVEIVAHVALNLFTNYVNVAFAVSVDFPAVKLRRDVWTSDEPRGGTAR